jgi:hypothetical protein
MLRRNQDDGLNLLARLKTIERRIGGEEKRHRSLEAAAPDERTVDMREAGARQARQHDERPHRKHRCERQDYADNRIAGRQEHRRSRAKKTEQNRFADSRQRFWHGMASPGLPAPAIGDERSCQLRVLGRHAELRAPVRALVDARERATDDRVVSGSVLRRRRPRRPVPGVERGCLAGS